MDTASRVYAPAAIQDRNNKVLSVDLAAVVTRLLLFDSYILESIWLQDLILFQHSFGTKGLAQLFESGALKFECAAFTFGQTGQARGTLRSDSPRPSLPLFNYQFSVLKVQDGEERIESALSTLDSSLRAEIIRGRVLRPPDYSKTVFDVFYRDMKTDLLDSAVRLELRRRGIIPISHRLEIEQREDDEFGVQTDLPQRYRLPAFGAHQIIENAMMALGRLDERVACMRAHSALTGLGDKDQTLLDAKLGAVARSTDFLTSEQKFGRVVAVKGLPVPEYGSTIVDVKGLLRVRESDECAAFKQWLAGSDKLSERELRERVSGLGRRIRQATLYSKVGKAVRFVTRTYFHCYADKLKFPIMLANNNNNLGTGPEVRRARLDAGLSQLQLALRAGISRWRLRLAEQGFCELHTGELGKIRQALSEPAPNACKEPRSLQGRQNPQRRREVK
jgi:hypothetical protein